MITPKVSLLLVDDDAALRLSFSIVLSAVGYRVRTASDGFGALLEIRLEHPEILISDMNMPGMSGFELLSVVRRRFPLIRVIAMSGGFVGDEKPFGISADAFHRKGSNLGLLLASLKEMSGAGAAPLQRTGEVAPIWIPRIVRDGVGMSLMTLTCPDCLRCFPQGTGTAEPFVTEVECRHCSSMIPGALIEAAEERGQLFSQPYLEAPPSSMGF